MTDNVREIVEETLVKACAAALNSINPDPDAWWVAERVPVSQTGQEKGIYERWQLWKVTQEQAEKML